MALKYTQEQVKRFFDFYSSGVSKKEFIDQLNQDKNVSKAAATLLWQAFDVATENWFEDFFKFVTVKNAERLDNTSKM